MKMDLFTDYVGSLGAAEIVSPRFYAHSVIDDV